MSSANLCILIGIFKSFTFFDILGFKFAIYFFVFFSSCISDAKSSASLYTSAELRQSFG